MNTKAIWPVIPVLAIVLLLAGASLIWLKSKDQASKTSQTNLIYYYSASCPHCDNVKVFVEKNNIRQQIEFESKEVSTSEVNANDFLNKIETCKLDYQEAGVPMLWDGKRCITGDNDIISYFQKRVK